MFLRRLAFYLTFCAFACNKSESTRRKEIDRKYEDMITAVIEEAIKHANLTESSGNTPKTETDQKYEAEIANVIEEMIKQVNTTKISEEFLKFLKEIEDAANKDEIFKHLDIKPSRRFMSWFKTVIANSTTMSTTRPRPSLVIIPPTTEQSIPENNIPGLHPSFVQNYLINVLQNLTQTLEKLNENIEIQNSLNPLRVVPLNGDAKLLTRRIKKEIPGNVSDVNIANATNATEAPSLLDDPEINACSTNVTRRFKHDSNPVIKQKLLGYLNDSFQEIETKVKPIQKIKKAYVKDNVFQIGYITSNIDTLEVSVLNLKKDMDKNNDQWDDKTIMDLFDKIMTTNKVMKTLIDSLYANYSMQNKQHTTFGIN